MCVARVCLHLKCGSVRRGRLLTETRDDEIIPAQLLFAQFVDNDDEFLFIVSENETDDGGKSR